MRPSAGSAALEVASDSVHRAARPRTACARTARRTRCRRCAGRARERVQESALRSHHARENSGADSEERSDPRAESCADDKRVPVDRGPPPGSRRAIRRRPGRRARPRGRAPHHAAAATEACARRTRRPAGHAPRAWTQRESRDRKDGDSDRAACEGVREIRTHMGTPPRTSSGVLQWPCRSHTCRRPAQLPPKRAFADVAQSEPVGRAGNSCTQWVRIGNGLHGSDAPTRALRGGRGARGAVVFHRGTAVPSA